MGTKPTLFLALLLCTAFAQAQTVNQTSSTDKRDLITIGLHHGVGNNANAYRSVSYTSDYSLYGKDAYASYGVDLAVAFAKRWRTRFLCDYVQSAYGVEWNNGSNFYKTNVALFNMDLGLKVDYNLFTYRKLNVFVSPGLTGEFVMGREYKNTFADGSTNYKKYNTLSDNDSGDSHYGATIGMLVKYNVTQWMGVKLDYDYARFFQKFHSDNSDPYSRSGIGFGLEFKLL